MENHEKEVPEKDLPQFDVFLTLTVEGANEDSAEDEVMDEARALLPCDGVSHRSTEEVEGRDDTFMIQITVRVTAASEEKATALVMSNAEALLSYDGLTLDYVEKVEAV